MAKGKRIGPGYAASRENGKNKIAICMAIYPERNIFAPAYFLIPLAVYNDVNDIIVEKNIILPLPLTT
jgi:hypothetical protein